MAEKRMFSKEIIGSDAFLDMPISTQALYFHLGMRADDDGFINAPNRIMKMCNANKNDLDLLIVKNYIIPFENGVIVIKHWRMNNYLRQDRYKPTNYQEEFNQLNIKDNGSYTCNKVLGIPMVDQLATQYSIDKSSIDKSSIDKDLSVSPKPVNPNISEIFNYWNSKNIIKHNELVDKIKNGILKALKIYSLEQIKMFIDRYDIVLKDNNYYFNTKWTLAEFLKQANAISTFTDDGSKWLNYQSRNSQVKNSKDFTKTNSDGNKGCEVF